MSSLISVGLDLDQYNIFRRVVRAATLLKISMLDWEPTFLAECRNIFVWTTCPKLPEEGVCGPTNMIAQVPEVPK